MNLLLTFDHGSIQPLPNELVLGPLAFPLYGLLIMIGVMIALWMGLEEGKKIGIDSKYILDGILIILPLSLLGTRLWYVIFNWDQFKDYLPSILGFYEDGFRGFQGLAVHGGFFTAIISVYIYVKVRKIDHLLVRGLDIIAPGFFVAQALGRWGNFFNREAHGGIIGGITNSKNWDAQRAFLSETLRLPDFITNNMFLYPKTGGDGWNYYHPTFLYESLWNVTGLIAILVLRRLKFTRSGDMLAVYLIWYSIGRFMIEGLRTDSMYMWNTNIRTAQVVSIVMILAGIAVLVFNHIICKRKKYHEYLAENRLKKE